MRMWRQICDINNDIIYGRLPSCDQCSHSRLQANTESSEQASTARPGQCGVCADWNPQGPIAKVLLVGIDSNIEPHELTYEKLMRQVTEAVKQVLDGQLNTTQKFQDYCGQEAVKPSVADGLFSLLSKNQEIIDELRGKNHQQIRDYLIRNNFFPAAWTGLRELRDFLDVPMHLLFLRITKETVAMVVAWLVTRQSLSQFAKEDGRKLDEIIELRLPSSPSTRLSLVVSADGSPPIMLP